MDNSALLQGTNTENGGETPLKEYEDSIGEACGACSIRTKFSVTNKVNKRHALDPSSIHVTGSAR